MKIKIFLLTFALACIFSGCNEPNMNMRDYKKLPALIEHCLTLSDDEIVSYLQNEGYSLVWNENEGTSEKPHRFLAFFPSYVFNQFSQRGEELAELYYESGDFYIGIFFESTNSFISGGIGFSGDFNQKMTLYKAYSEWAYENLPEFATYEWRASLAGEDFLEGSHFEDTYGRGGFREYMQALDSAAEEDFTFNYAVGPNNNFTGAISPDYEILFQQEECMYSRNSRAARK